MKMRGYDNSIMNHLTRQIQTLGVLALLAVGGVAPKSPADM